MQNANEYKYAYLIGFFSLFLLLLSAYFVYQWIAKVFSKNKQKLGSLWLSFILSAFFIILAFSSCQNFSVPILFYLFTYLTYKLSFI
jgi:hypothetical protein